MSFSGSSTHMQISRISASSAEIEARSAQMASRRAVIEESVEALLATWHGAAARRFGELWSQWRHNADVVIDGLGEAADSLRGARDLMLAADTEACATHDRIRGRLG